MLTSLPILRHIMESAEQPGLCNGFHSGANQLYNPKSDLGGAVVWRAVRGLFEAMCALPNATERRRLCVGCLTYKERESK